MRKVIKVDRFSEDGRILIKNTALGNSLPNSILAKSSKTAAKRVSNLENSNIVSYVTPDNGESITSFYYRKKNPLLRRKIERIDSPKIPGLGDGEYISGPSINNKRKRSYFLKRTVHNVPGKYKGQEYDNISISGTNGSVKRLGKQFKLKFQAS